jgi:hypothetical protein
MTTSIISLPVIGIEPIQRAAFKQLFAGLNGALAQMALFMDRSDDEIATLTGRTYEPTTLEPVEPENFYEGHRPSLINAPIGKYPNCSVMANQATPATLDLVDQADAYRCNLFVEVMAKTTDSEETVNRRVQRMAEAVNLTMMSDQSLGGVVTAFDGPPVVVVGDVFVRKEKTSYGAEWLWQGARLEYAVRKEASRPSSNGAVLPAFDIDQA